MCAIIGIVNVGISAPFDKSRFEAATRSMAHRGPDGQRVETIGDEAILGHRRLSIIDLSDDSAQPMLADGRYWITYNGEIFNYIEIREELRELGVQFQTNGDTEVLLRAYAQWGEACVPRLNGMWAFAIYDRQEKTLFCSRDRYGQKPFNYAMFEGRFYFASEIKSMLAYESGLLRPNYNAISNFCRSSVGAQHPETWFEDVLRLQPGCNLLLKNGQIEIRRYWTYPETVDRVVSFDDAKRRYVDLFRDAVKIRMRSDVPLGLTLSGGLDSNSIAYVMQSEDPAPHYSFTASFRDGEEPQRPAQIFVDAQETADEALAASETAKELGLKSEIVRTDYSGFARDLVKIVYHLESGNSAPAVIPLMQLLREARTRLTVVLEGQGADELLCGYVGALVWDNTLDLLRAGKFLEACASLWNYTRTYKLWFAVILALRAASNSLPVILRVHQWLTGIDRVFGSKLRRFTPMGDFPPYAEEGRSTRVTRALRRQHVGGLVNLLHYGDAISMANSIESRLPFLDHRLVEFVWRLPSDFKMRLGIGKYIHRQAMRGLVPDRIIDNPIKYGFCTPVSEQFRMPVTGLDHDPISVLMSERCLARGIFDREGLAALIAKHRSGTRDHGPLLFRLLSTELWFRTFIDPPAPTSESGCIAQSAQAGVTTVPA